MNFRRKIVLIFSTAYVPAIGGAERAVEEITKRLGDQYSFVLVTARLSSALPRREQIGMVDVFRIGIGTPMFDKILLAFFGARAGERALGGKIADTVWGIMASYGGLAALRYKEKHPSTRFLLTLQEGDDISHIARRARWLGSRFKSIFARADAVQAISRYLAQWAQVMGTQALVTVVPNGVDIEKFNPPVGGRSSTSVKLITTSRLVKKNAVDDSIRALAHLPKHVVLEVVGDGVERDNLENLVRSLNLSGRVHFRGNIFPEDIPQALANADIFVRPSLSEGLGNSFLEAFAVGLPTIGTPVGGIPDFLIDGETGWFAEPRNPESIAACVRYILDPAHKEHVDRVTTAARALVETTYTWESVAGQLKTLLS